MEIRKDKGTSSEDLARLRREYLHRGLDEAELDRNPFAQFKRWLDDALAAPFLEPTAMTLATASKDGKPSARMVLLKKFDEQGFVFFTNYGSRKAEELTSNPNASLLLYWDALERQVRIEGTIERATEEESKQYFDSRPFASRIAAIISHQSRVVGSRAELEKKFDELAAQYTGALVPRPPFWGGFRVLPHTFEFWQGRENRLHDRFRYSKTSDGWKVERLSP